MATVVLGGIIFQMQQFRFKYAKNLF